MPQLLSRRRPTPGRELRLPMKSPGCTQMTQVQAQAVNARRSDQPRGPRRHRDDAKRLANRVAGPYYGGMGSRNPRKLSRGRPKIFFYNKGEPHYGFTNFSPHSVVYEAKLYPTSEHLFQSFKVSRPLISARVLNRISPHRSSSFINPP
jgi:hypothetical protein